ncbi:MAG TPA: hypothetical protein VFU74_07070 [Actinocrinis sp.]|nr:hypothetical protein [Actinocrinis sp.]
MNITRLTSAAVASAFVLTLATVSACGSGSGGPTTSGSAPSAPMTSAPAQTSPTGPSATPTPTPSRTTPAPRPTTSAPASPRTVVSRVTYAWHWPNDPAKPGSVTHRQSVPPVPELIRIGAGDHPATHGERAFNRMSFTFTAGFPSYHFEFVDHLVADGSGKTVPLAGDGVLRIVFNTAQAHTASGASSVLQQPSRHLGLSRMVDYANAGDFEGYVTYGIGVEQPIEHSNPQFAVRAYEVETVTPSGQHQYTIALDIDASAR